MLNEDKKKVLDSLINLCSIYPQQRLGQIIYNYIIAPIGDPFYIEDKKLAELLDKEIEKNIQKMLDKIDNK